MADACALAIFRGMTLFNSGRLGNEPSQSSLRDASSPERESFLHSYRKPQAMLVEEKSRSVETVEKEPPFAIIRSG